MQENKELISEIILNMHGCPPMTWRLKANNEDIAMFIELLLDNLDAEIAESGIAAMEVDPNHPASSCESYASAPKVKFFALDQGGMICVRDVMISN